jgi:hypothetical protein
MGALEQTEIVPDKTAIQNKIWVRGVCLRGQFHTRYNHQFELAEKAHASATMDKLFRIKHDYEKILSGCVYLICRVFLVYFVKGSVQDIEIHHFKVTV